MNMVQVNRDANQGKNPYLIGVSGGTASGKTSTCWIIQKQLQEESVNTSNDKSVVIISMDSFYLGLQEGEDVDGVNFDHPSSFDWDLMFEVFNKLKNGQSVHIPIYNFKTHKREGSVLVEALGCIIFEGILSLYEERLRDLFDIKIFVDTPPDIRLIRRIRRDIEERGRTLESVLAQCEETVIPSHDHFIEPTKKYADLIIPRGKTNITAIKVMVNQIRKKI